MFELLLGCGFALSQWRLVSPLALSVLRLLQVRGSRTLGGAATPKPLLGLGIKMHLSSFVPRPFARAFLGGGGFLPAAQSLVSEQAVPKPEDDCMYGGDQSIDEVRVLPTIHTRGWLDGLGANRELSCNYIGIAVRS